MTSEHCYFTVFWLKVPGPIEIGDALLLPIPTESDNGVFGTEFQQEWLSRWLSVDGDAASLIRVSFDQALGDDAVDVARRVAESALARLRLALDKERWLPREQLRFAIGGVRWVPGHVSGFARTGALAFSFEPEEQDPALQRLASDPIINLPLTPENDAQRRASLAADWMTRAYMESNETIQLLFGFSALEALLGNKASGLKGPELAIRRATLAFEVSGMFRHPSKTFDLYDQVRSAAVHGEQAPELSKNEASMFISDIRDAIEQYLTYAKEHNLTKRSQIRAGLDTCEARSKIVARLVDENPKKWSPLAEARA